MSSPDSSSEDEQEKERKRQLQEAVSGVKLPSTSSGPPPKKSKYVLFTSNGEMYVT